MNDVQKKALNTRNSCFKIGSPDFSSLELNHAPVENFENTESLIAAITARHAYEKIIVCCDDECIRDTILMMNKLFNVGTKVIVYCCGLLYSDDVVDDMSRLFDNNGCSHKINIKLTEKMFTDEAGNLIISGHSDGNIYDSDGNVWGALFEKTYVGALDKCIDFECKNKLSILTSLVHNSEDKNIPSPDKIFVFKDPLGNYSTLTDSSSNADNPLIETLYKILVKEDLTPETLIYGIQAGTNLPTYFYDDAALFCFFGEHPSHVRTMNTIDRLIIDREEQEEE